MRAKGGGATVCTPAKLVQLTKQTKATKLAKRRNDENPIIQRAPPTCAGGEAARRQLGDAGVAGARRQLANDVGGGCRRERAGGGDREGGRAGGKAQGA